MKRQVSCFPPKHADEDEESTVMKVTSLAISDVRLLEPKIFRDERGFFSETYSTAALAEQGLDDVFVQDNHSLSRAKGVLRGLHFQVPPYAQAKLVRVVAGAIFDVAVDIRKASPTYGKWVGATLSAENWGQLYVPSGFAHGFCTLEPDTQVIYKVTEVYAPDAEKAIAWNDPELAIDWPLKGRAPILSTRDGAHPPLSDLPAYF